LLLKGHEEVGRAALPIEACEMALLRLVHASTLPDPGELARMIQNGAPPVAATPVAPPPAPSEPVAAALPQSIEAIVTVLENAGELALASRVVHHVSLISIADVEIIVSSARPLPSDLIAELGGTLKRITGRMWRISTAPTVGAPTLREAEAARREAFKAEILATPVIVAALEAFPDASLPESEIDRLLAAQRSKSA
jgi:DNA polymerase-3 subunit gamma/tau